MQCWTSAKATAKASAEANGLAAGCSIEKVILNSGVTFAIIIIAACAHICCATARSNHHLNLLTTPACARLADNQQGHAYFAGGRHLPRLLTVCKLLYKQYGVGKVASPIYPPLQNWEN